MKTTLTFTQAFEGYELHIQSRRLSQHTWLDYSNTYRKFLAFLNDDPPLARITARDIEGFLAEQDDVSKKNPAQLPHRTLRLVDLGS
jgi:site-specific recombinase XerD